MLSTLLATLVLVAPGLAGPCPGGICAFHDHEETAVNAQPTRDALSRSPPIDARRPAHVRTATFALG